MEDMPTHECEGLYQKRTGWTAYGGCVNIEDLQAPLEQFMEIEEDVSERASLKE